MDTRQAFAMAMKNLLANKVRCVQTLLGTIIGVAAVVVILSYTQGTLNAINASFKQLSPSLMQMGTYRPVDSSQNFTVEDMEALAAAHPEYIIGVTPIIDVPGGVKYGDQVFAQTAVMGVSDFMLETAPVLQLAEGRFLQHMDIDREQNVCVIGAGVAEEVLPGDALNKTLRIQGQNYQVVGVMANIEDDYHGFNSCVYIPYTNAQKLTPENIIHAVDDNDYYLTLYYVNANGMDNIANARVTVHDALKSVYGEDIFHYSASFRYYREGAITPVLSTCQKLLVAAGLVLLVGGVGIMNVMLAVVNERVKEIGVRKAFGARKADIRIQFVIESASSSLVGGLIGIGLGGVGTWTVCQFMQLPLNAGLLVTPVLVALVISVLVGVLFGYLPANKAAKLEIADTLRD